MRISQGCIQQVVGVASDGTIKGGAEKLRKRHVGSFVVVDGSPVGDLGNAPIGRLVDPGETMLQRTLPGGRP